MERNENGFSGVDVRGARSGSQSNGRCAGTGEPWNGNRTNGNGMNGNCTNGNRTNDNGMNDNRTNGNGMNGNCTNGNRTNGNRTNGNHMNCNGMNRMNGNNGGNVGGAMDSGNGGCLGGECAGCSDRQLAMVYSPYQCWRMTYSPSEALNHGTLFEELYKPLEGYSHDR